jgi:hypothetical protein
MFKMLNALSLNVGEFFAEVSSKDLSYRKNWLLAKKSLTDGLRECLQNCSELGSKSNPEASSSQVSINYFLTQSSNLTRHSDFEHIAYLTTSGFEQLGEFSKTQFMPVHTDLSFGMTERTLADGSIEKSPTLDDLEFMVAKLELLNIKHLAICFLHSNLNSENEIQVANFFKKKGLEVYCSSQENKSLTELERFRNTFARARFGYRMFQIEKSFETLNSESFDLKYHFLNKVNFDSNYFGFTSLESLKIEKNCAQLHFGLESFLLKDESQTWELKLAPTTSLNSGFFHTPGFSNQILTFDPGPMIMGKSFMPTLIDFLFSAEHLASLDAYGLSPVAPEKTKARILESILALVRNNQDRKHIDLQKELLKLEKILAYKLWAEIITLSNFRKLKVSGPLNAPFLKILKSFKPQNIELSISPENFLFLEGRLNE